MHRATEPAFRGMQIGGVTYPHAMANRRGVGVALCFVAVSVLFSACGSSAATSSANPADTTIGSDFSLTSSQRCSATQEQEVTWELQNSGADLDILAASVTGAAPGMVTFSPQHVASGETTKAVSVVPGSLQGDLVLDVEATFGSPIKTGESVHLTGVCG